MLFFSPVYFLLHYSVRKQSLGWHYDRWTLSGIKMDNAVICGV